MVLDTDKITEAEVSLRLAFFLIERGYAATDVSVALDGAQIQTATTVHFPISAFLAAYGWTKAQAEQRWQGAYSHATLPFSGSLGIAVVDILIITHQEDVKEFFSFSSKMNNKSLLFHGFLVS